MITLTNIILVLIAYLLGSIPTAVWVGKSFYNIDVRKHGSGNAGATNTFRVLGKKAGIPVLIIDIFKGFISVFVLSKFSTITPNTNEFITFQIILGVMAVLGHIFPIFASFKGGKGVATMLGIIIALHPSAALMCIGIFLIVFLISGYISLGSLIAAITFPLAVIFIFNSPFIALKIFSVCTALLIFVTHRANIKRLLQGNENKMNIFGKK